MSDFSSGVLKKAPAVMPISGATPEDLACILEAGGDGLVALDSAWRCIYVNGNAERLLHVPAARFLGKEFWEAFPDAIGTRFYATAYASMTGEVLPPSEEMLPFFGGWREYRFRRTEKGLLILFRDASERKEWERERYRLVSAMHDQAERDPLTGLLRHRAFYQRLHIESERARREGKPVAIVMLDIEGFKTFNDVNGYAMGDALLKQIAEALRQSFRAYDIIARIGGDEFAVLLPGVRRADADRLFQESRLRRFLGLDGTSGGPSSRNASANPKPKPTGPKLIYGIAVYPDDSDNALAALALADDDLFHKKQAGLDAPTGTAPDLRSRLTAAFPGFPSLDALVTAIDSKDRYTRRHSEDVARHVRGIARPLGLSDEAAATLEVAALLHDVGKIGIPDHVLRRPAQLTDDEFEGVKQHAALGAAMVASMLCDGPQSAIVQQIVSAIRHHHEAWDGTGYPSGLRGEEIPFYARIIAVADAYSAMTTDRTYRAAKTSDEAMSVLKSLAGQKWDALCVQALAYSLGQ